MGAVHDLIEAKGKQEALKLPFDRQVIEAAAAYMADEETGIGFLYSGCVSGGITTSTPPPGQGWQIDSDA